MLLEAEILDPRWTRPWAPGPVQEALRGSVIERLSRSGKYLVWELSGERYLLVHLRMTGSLLFDPLVDPVHTRVRFELEGGHRLLYVDPRRFGTGELLPLIGDAGADVVGVDWRVPLDEAARRVGPGRSLQGNLDPAVLLADRATVDREVRRVVEQGRAARGHVFNLGHGVLPDTDPGVLTSVVELVHELSA